MMSALVLLGFAQVAPAQVTIERTAPVIERRTFDPAHPPADMPTLHPREAAVTQSFFGAETRVGGNVTEERQLDDGKTKVSIKVDTIHVTVKLRVTIWLPKNATRKLTNHEEAHRTIAEHYYQDAERQARAAAEPYLAKTITGIGTDSEDAGNVSLKQTAQEIGGIYLGNTDGPCSKAQDAFDEMTAHGTNAVKEQKAIADSINRATTAPATDH